MTEPTIAQHWAVNWVEMAHKASSEAIAADVAAKAKESKEQDDE